MTRNASRWLAGAAAILMLAIAAIVVPPLLRTRESARSNSCWGNTKQISRALLMYAQENNDRLPPVGDWQASLSPCIHSDRIFICVAREDEPTPHFALSPQITLRSLDELEAPENVLLFYEIDATGRLVFPHDGGAHYAFADGHSKWVSRKEAHEEYPELTHPRRD